MKLSVTDLIVIADTLAASLVFVQSSGNPFRYTVEVRKELLQKLLDQCKKADITLERQRQAPAGNQR